MISEIIGYIIGKEKDNKDEEFDSRYENRDSEDPGSYNSNESRKKAQQDAIAKDLEDDNNRFHNETIERNKGRKSWSYKQ